MTTYNSTQLAAGIPVNESPAGVLCVAYGSYNYAAALADGDVLAMCRVPANSTVVGGYMFGSDLDTDATEALDLDVGWADDTDGFGNFGIVSGDVVTNLMPVAGIFKPLQGTLLTGGVQAFTEETTINILINTNAATLTAGYLSLVVYYTQTATTTAS